MVFFLNMIRPKNKYTIRPKEFCVWQRWWKRLGNSTRAVARTEMGGFWTNRFVENGFYLKRVSLGLGNLENGLKPGITRVNLKKMGLKKPG